MSAGRSCSPVILSPETIRARSLQTAVTREHNSFYRVVSKGNHTLRGFSAHSTRFVWPSAFRPCVLAFLGLALAVAGWGFIYRVSLYQPNSGLRCIVAKLWDKQHTVQTSTNTVNEAKVAPRRACILELLSRSPQPCPYPGAAYFAAHPRIPVCLASFKYRLPFRSPPLKTISY